MHIASFPNRLTGTLPNWLLGIAIDKPFQPVHILHISVKGVIAFTGRGVLPHWVRGPAKAVYAVFAEPSVLHQGVRLKDVQISLAGSGFFLEVLFIVYRLYLRIGHQNAHFG